MRCIRSAPLLALATLALTCSISAEGPTSAPALPFTLSKETTVINSPLKPDGTPDYVAALNDRYSKGVTPQNNAYAAFVQATGTESGMFAPAVHDKTLAILGIQATPANAQLWEDCYEYLSRGRSNADAEKENQVFDGVRQRVWKAAEAPLVVAYLNKEAKVLDRIVEISAMPHWWAPAVTQRGGVMEVLLPSLGRVRSVAQALCVRAGLRAGSGDFDGFLSDAMAVKRLARLEGVGRWSVIEMLVGIAIENQASEILGNAAGSGLLTDAQCAKVRVALDTLGPWPADFSPMDVGERWTELDIATRLAVGDLSPIKPYMDANKLSEQDLPITLLDYRDADWNYILKRINEEMDRRIQAMQAPSVKESTELFKKLEQELQDWKEQIGTGMAAAEFKRHEGESRENFSERVARLLLVMYIPSLGRVEELRQRTVMSEQMLDALLAAAQYKAKKGQWPATLQALVPGLLDKVPADIYADGAPVRLWIGPHGMRIHSIGSAGKDTTWPPTSGGSHVSVGATFDLPVAKGLP